MRRTLALIACSTSGIAVLAVGVLFFVHGQGLRGYATALMYTAFGVGVMAAFMVTGSGDRRAVAEFAQSMAVADKVRGLDDADRQRGLSIGLVLLYSAMLASLVGYGLSQLAA
jgi:predicted DNA repair protein MutK